MRTGFLLSLLLVSAPRARGADAFVDDERLEQLQAALKDGKEELEAPVRRKRRHMLLSARLPTWELAAVRGAYAFASEGIPLTAEDKRVAAAVFADALDLEAVRLVYAAIALPAVPQTWGNVIRVPEGQPMGRVTLIHELVHVWQFQTRGTDYISDSVLHNGWSLLTTGKRKKAYKYKIVKGKSFFDYTAEQQAKIVDNFYAKKKLQQNPEYQRLIDEMRTRKAMPQDDESAAALEEREGGLAPRQWSVQPMPGEDEPREGGGSVPQLEFRFDTPW